MVRIVCWNINRSLDAWAELRETDDADVALLQEVGKGAARQMADAIGEGVSWDWRRSNIWPAVVRLSHRVKVEVFAHVAPECGGMGQNTIAVSDSRTLAAARVTPLRDGKTAGDPFFVFSMYARWFEPHPHAGRTPSRREGRRIGIYSDGSAHRIISDLSAFIGHTNPSSHRLLAAGDLNTIYGAADNNRLEKPARAQTIFDRMHALGMEFKGPQWPDANARAEPVPQGLPKNTKNVPTYLTAWERRRMDGRKIISGNQLDYVFASRGFHETVHVRALNDVTGFEPSDHCRIQIDVH